MPAERIRMWVSGLYLLVAMALSQPAAFANSVPVTMALVSPPPGTIVYDAYISPYQAQIAVSPATITCSPTLACTSPLNPPATTVICDDFDDETTVKGGIWDANALTGSNIAAQNSPYYQGYEEIGYLAFELGAATTTTQQANISFAIWDVFADAQVKSWLETPADSLMTAAQGALVYSAVTALVANAAANATVADFNALTVYRPNGNSPSCFGNATGCNTDQEFITVTVPEASGSVILAINLMALFGAVLLIRRRGFRAHS